MPAKTSILGIDGYGRIDGGALRFPAPIEPDLRRLAKLLQPLATNPARTIGLCLTEARPQVLAIFGLRFAVGAALGWPVFGGQPIRTIATALVWELAVFFVYLFNGISDVDEDRVNGSTRPIARGAVDPGLALVIAIGAALTALVGALIIGGPTAWLVPVLLGLGYLYSGRPFYLKRHSASTAAIGMAGGLLSYAAGLTSPAATTTLKATATLATFAIGASLWMGLTGTLAKDLPDIAGDLAAGRSSVAAQLGERKARTVLSRTALTVAAVFALVSLVASHSLRAPAAAMLVGAVVLAAIAASRLSHGSRHQQRRPYRAFMLTQYATHLCVLVPVILHVPAI
jgi:4-hydroxybenzoate polyprenyltransferase